MNTEEFDIVVIGAGVAGGVFAASQPKHVKILVIERNLSEKERIVGELMQPDGLIALKNLGLEQLTENIDAQRVNGYKLIKGKDDFAIEYNTIDKDIKGLGLRNGKFLLNIQKHLESLKNVSLIEGNVIELIEDDKEIKGVKYQIGEQTIEARAKLTVASDGHNSLFRKHLGQGEKKVQSYFMGLVLENLKLQSPKLGHMIVSGDAPILVYPIKSNAYRILVDYPGEKPPRMGSKSLDKFREDVSSILPKEMLTSFHEALKNQQVIVMPNHQMKAQAFRKKGALLLGDSLNMRHPLTGGGMTAAFNDIITLRGKLKTVNFSNSGELNVAIEDYYNSRSKQVETINILANALYKVFRNEELKEACFEYLKKGGEKSRGPLSILAGINKNKKYLLKHFFKVAMQHPQRFVTAPRKQMRIYKNALAIIRPILKDEEKPAIA